MIFRKLKELIITACILILPIEGEGFAVCCDTFDIGLSCVLIPQGRVIALRRGNLRPMRKTNPYITWSWWR